MNCSLVPVLEGLDRGGRTSGGLGPPPLLAEDAGEHEVARPARGGEEREVLVAHLAQPVPHLVPPAGLEHRPRAEAVEHDQRRADGRHLRLGLLEEVEQILSAAAFELLRGEGDRDAHPQGLRHLLGRHPPGVDDVVTGQARPREPADPVEDDAGEVDLREDLGVPVRGGRDPVECGEEVVDGQRGGFASDVPEDPHDEGLEDEERGLRPTHRPGEDVEADGDEVDVAVEATEVEELLRVHRLERHPAEDPRRPMPFAEGDRYPGRVDRIPQGDPRPALRPQSARSIRERWEGVPGADSTSSNIRRPRPTGTVTRIVSVEWDSRAT